MDEIKDQTIRNTVDIEVVKSMIITLRDNHLHHLKEDVEEVNRKVDKLEAKIDKVDSKIYYILLGVIGSVIVPGILKLLGIV